jgi:K+-transporting ATPase ATPase B chain
MFVVYVGSILHHAAVAGLGGRARPAGFHPGHRAVAVVHRAVRQLRRGLAEGRSKAQAASLRGLKKTTWAKKLTGEYQPAPPRTACPGTRPKPRTCARARGVLVEAGDT